MNLTVLHVGCPFAPVGADPVGGAEQVLAQLDRALVAAGHDSLVIASAGSHVCGRFVPVPHLEPNCEAARTLVQRAVRRAIDGALAHEHIDLIHFHGSDFDAYLPPHGPPAVVSLHLPLSWYAPAALRSRRPLTWLQPVSASQARSAPADVSLLPAIENGIDCKSFPRRRKREFALVLGRVCREKGFHDAIDACKLAGVPLVAAGTVFSWPEHRRYFAQEVRPRLDADRRWIGAVAGRRKRRLLAAARCVLVPSTAPETSSLVAMEALAAGTPVVAYPSGALAEIVEHGLTGYLVDSVAAMAYAIHCTDRIDPQNCRRRAQERFALERTIAAYFALYERLAQIGSAAFGNGARSCSGTRDSQGRDLQHELQIANAYR